MSLETKIMEDLKTAMKAKDQASMRTLRSIKSAILLFQTSGTGDELTEEKEIKLLQKLVKQRKDSLEIYEKQNREDLAQTEREEIEVIEKYLPKAMSMDELRAFVKNLVQELGAASMKDMGRVMGMANQQLAGKADGKTLAGIVKEILSA